MREFIIRTDILEESIKTLQPFISKDEVRYYINGIFFEYSKEEERLNLVATDGHKLCVLKPEIDPEQDMSGNIRAIVPTAALKTILQILKGSDDEHFVTLKFSDDNNTMWIEAKDTKAEFKLIDGVFPDYRKVVPSEKPKFAIGFQKDQASEALKAVVKHKGKEAMEWQITDAHSPLKLVGENKIVVVMPCRTTFGEIDIGKAA